jgi:mannitol-specific phosphotransferase system IIBC component
MKNLKTIAMLMMVFFTVTIISCKEAKNDEKQEVKHSHQDDHDHKDASNHKSTTQNVKQDISASFTDINLNSIFHHYIKIKNGLVQSDASVVQMEAKNLAEKVDNESLKTTVIGISMVNDIEIQRKAFAEVTTMLEPMLKNSINSGKVYKQFCPMAFGNTGGYWLSDKEEIRNPYFGDRMLKCGRVAETIQKL